jgi:hypothetical protein
MATPREYAEAKRQTKLADIERMVAVGTLVIRQMTAEERRLSPPRRGRSDGRGRSRARRPGIDGS